MDYRATTRAKKGSGLIGLIGLVRLVERVRTAREEKEKDKEITRISSGEEGGRRKEEGG